MVRHRPLSGLSLPILTVAVVAALAGGGCASPRDSSGRVAVVATTTQVADFARVIGGDRVTVTGLLQPGVDPHDYEESPADIESVRTAKVVVRNGLGLDAWLDRAITAAGRTGLVVDTSTGVALRKGSGDSAPDPHIWHNPRNAVIMATNIERGLAEVDPVGASGYAERLLAYVAQLDALDVAIAAEIGALPNKNLVTNHDAFGYFVDRYGLVFVGSVIPSFDTSAEPTPADLSRLVGKIKLLGVKAVFAESSLPARAAQALANEAGVKVVSGSGALYGDSLGPVGSPAATYLTMMKHNADTIASNLR